MSLFPTATPRTRLAERWREMDLTTPDRELRPLLADLPALSLSADLAATRRWFGREVPELVHRVQRNALPPEGAYVVADHTVPVDDGGAEIGVRSYRPAAATMPGHRARPLPLLLWCHGGGVIFGNLDMEDYLWKIVCVELELIIIHVDYRLAPEHPFPTGHDDCYAALRWVVGNHSSLGADLAAGFLVGGLSAGGSLTAGMTHRAKHDTLFSKYPLTGQILSSPTVCHPDGLPEELRARVASYVENADAPVLDLVSLRGCYGILDPPPSDPLGSPLLYAAFDGLPPAYLQVCGMDPLRDEGLLYAEKLEASGVATKVDVYAGAPHIFQLLFPETELARKYERDLKAGICWLLSFAGGR